MRVETSSLCIVRKRNEHAEPMFIRIADIYNNEMVCADYNPGSDDGLKPITIGNRKGENKTVGEAQIRIWSAREDEPKYNDSWKTELQFHEIVYCRELDGINVDDDVNIRNALYDGVVLPEMINDDFLLAPYGNMHKEGYALVCKKRFFQKEAGVYSISRQCSDLVHITPTMDRIILKPQDVISTITLDQQEEFRDNIPTRYFYKRMELSFEKLDTINLYSIEAFASNYLKSYMNRKRNEINYTKREISQICEVIEKAFHDQEMIQEYYRNTGYILDDVLNALSSDTEVITTELLSEDTLSKIILNVVSNNTELLDQCKKEVREQWLSEKDEERETIEAELIEIRDKKRAAIEELETKIDDYKNRESEIKKLEKRKEEKMVELASVDKRINAKLEAFENDIVEKAFARALVTEKNREVTCTRTRVCTSYSEPQNQDHITCTEEFLDYLEENLIEAGVEGKWAFECSLFIVSTMLIKKGLLVGASIGAEIANAISMIVDGCNASVITLENGEIDYRVATDAVKQAKTRVVLVENCVDSLNDGLIIQIKRECDTKHLLFSYSRDETIKLLSDEVMRVISWLNCKSCVLPLRVSRNYQQMNTNIEIFDVETDCSDIEKNIKNYKELNEITKCDKAELYEFTLIEMMIEQMNSSKGDINTFNAMRLKFVDNIEVDDIEEFFRGKVIQDAVDLLIDYVEQE